MTKFIYAFERTTNTDCLLFPGQYACKIIESATNEGQTFSEIMHELSTNLTNPDVLALMNMQYILYIKVRNPIDEETFGDIKVGLRELDKTSLDCRMSNAKTTEEKYKESMRRPYAHLYIQGLFDAEAFAMSFDAVQLDLIDVPEDQLKSQLVQLVAIGNRPCPTTFVISTELANKLMDAEFKESPLGTYLYNKSIVNKNVFAIDTVKDVYLENKSVRAIY